MKTEKEINKIFTIFAKDNPHPKTELKYINNYTLAIAVILSAQATDKGVNRATEALFSKIQTPEQMLNLGVDNLTKYIKTIGLYNAKVKNIMLMSKKLVEDYHSEIPNNFDELIKLPGIGRKTANVILNCVYNQPTIAVDTHVFRTANRIGLSDKKTPELVEKDLLKSIPKKWLHNAHHWLVLHGRYVCKARKPLCLQCKINKFCDYYRALGK